MARRGQGGLPAPLTPAKCDLNGFDFMPLLLARLWGSEFHLKANPLQWRAGVTLWGKSWHQVPAGSLPDDDEVLFQLADLGKWATFAEWPSIKTVAMRHWVKCDDGRLYHPFIAKEVKKAWLERVKYKREKNLTAARMKKYRQRKAKIILEPSFQK